MDGLAEWWAEAPFLAKVYFIVALLLCYVFVLIMMAGEWTWKLIMSAGSKFRKVLTG